jgi:hypothetical protein
MVEKKLDVSNNILHVKSAGDVQLDGMLRGVEFIEKSTDLPRRLRILEDASTAKVTFNHTEIEIIMKHLEQAAQHYESIRHAIIVSDPKTTAFTMLAAIMINNKNYSMQTFSSKLAAEKWLELF